MATLHTFRWLDGTRTEKLNMGRAIRAHCAECYGFDDWMSGVRDCSAPLCALYPFRFGKDPGKSATSKASGAGKTLPRRPRNPLFEGQKSNRTVEDGPE